MRPALCAALLLFASLAQGQPAGKMVSTGSDTLGALSTVWAQAVMQRYPEVTVQVRAVGSSAAPTSLVEGTADIGPMSRPMTAAEIGYFRDRYGYPPTAVPVAVDTLAVFVHRSNPLRSLDREQLDALFSANRRCGARGALHRWGDLGGRGVWQPRLVTRYGRDAASGTYGFFRNKLLCDGDFAARVNRLVGSAAVVRAVGGDPSAIGYASAGFLSNSVKRIRILDPAGADVNLSRDLLLYVNRPPDRELAPLVRIYLREALGNDGQAAVSAAGYTALPLSRRQQLRDALQLGRDR